MFRSPEGDNSGKVNNAALDCSEEAELAVQTGHCGLSIRFRWKLWVEEKDKAG